MKFNASIKYLDYYLPKGRISIDEILSLNKDGEDTQVFKEQSGIRHISVFTQNDNIAEIVSNMIDKLLQTTKIKPAEIKYLVCGNPVLMGDKYSIIHYIHKKFNMEKATILSIFQLCASTLIAMGLSGNLLSSAEDEYALILSANKSPDLKKRYLGYTVQGDGISLVLMENKPGKTNLTHCFSYYNGTNSYQIIEGGCHGQDLLKLKLKIVKEGALFLQRSADKIKIPLDSFDTIIPPNTTYDVWDKLYSCLLDIEPGKFYLDNMGVGGHINDVDLIRNLKDYIDKKTQPNTLKKKDIRILIYAIDLFKSMDINYHIISLELPVME